MAFLQRFGRKKKIAPAKWDLKPARRKSERSYLVAIAVATVLLWHRSRSMPGPRRRRSAVVSGWGDLLRLVASVARGVLWLIAVLLLLGRIVFWPSGRRW